MHLAVVHVVKLIKYFSVISALGLVGCQLPDNQGQHQQAKLAQHHSQQPISYKTIPQQVTEGLSQFYTLEDPFTSIAARIHLIQQAQHQLDLQYYIWNNDPIGRYVLGELLKAADRGVKIRLIIDDQNGNQLDDLLLSLAQHQHIQIGIFNPYKYRDARWLDMLTRSLHINQRMHNKLIVRDGLYALTGGRNISAEYFDAGQKFQFTDLDVMFYGASAQQAQDSFDAYWQSDLNYSIEQLLRSKHVTPLDQLRQQFANEAHLLVKEQQVITLALTDVQRAFDDTAKDWVPTQFYADVPEKAKGINYVAQEQLLIYRLFEHMGRPDEHLELVSAYFVPGNKGVDYIGSLRERNVPVRILTNSLAANDVALVHAYYAPYRKALLKQGVKLYEFKPYLDRDRTWYERVSGNVIPAKERARSSLHAKFFDIDGHVFIGSFNFDPRSAYLNTEVGVAIDSDPLQNRLTQALDEYLPLIAYELVLNENDDIIWREYLPNGNVIEHAHDPHTTRFQRAVMAIIAIFPFEWMM